MNHTFEMLDGVRIVQSNIKLKCEDKIGSFMTDNDYDLLVDADTDFYAPASFGDVQNEENIIFKFRKNAFTDEQQRGAYDGLVGAATPTQNRGKAAGPKEGRLNNRDWVTDEQSEILQYFIDSTTSLLDDDPIETIRRKYAGSNSGARGLVWLRSQIADAGYNYDTFFSDKVEELSVMLPEEASKHASFLKKSFISDTTYANQVLSGIAGFFDRYPRIPYGRATSYTEKNYSTYEKCYPFMIQLADKFKEMLPLRHGIQDREANKLDSRFRVAGEKTPFTTITVNKNFRTAAHRDAGDLHEGFSNLTVVANDKEWQGGYLVLPEYRVAINIRPGDLLLINNHDGIHGNTEMLPPEGKTVEEMERISLVCYFREKMLELGSWEYEKARYDYVESRRKDSSHPLWHKLWNGVSPSMWDNQEWYDYLESELGETVLQKYHPEAMSNNSLEEFFL
jgi:hypothetical protein